ncbi:uncharacterized protein LOC114853232 [Betta splendens]|uniref:Uncharacterized protein LOC114853232 n=1 Tax=Betta splendens TaxID=158456 RepID=A0A6P7M886_BETSP|nr:uncharacterized protein LOC114853232 [Betta splendens]
MKFARAGFVLLIFLSVGRSAPVTVCESLTQTLQIRRDDLLGKWFLIAESTNLMGSQLLINMLADNAWANIVAESKDDSLKAHLYYKMLGSCFSLSPSYSLVNNSITMERPYLSTAVLLNTGCPDCLVFFTQVTWGKNSHAGAQLLSRRSEVTADQLQEFKQQVECLSLPSPAVLDAKKGFCPDKSEAHETKITDLTDAMNNMGSNAMETLSSYFNSQSGLMSLIDLVKSGVAALQEQ